MSALPLYVENRSDLDRDMGICISESFIDEQLDEIREWQKHMQANGFAPKIDDRRAEPQQDLEMQSFSSVSVEKPKEQAEEKETTLPAENDAIENDAIEDDSVAAVPADPYNFDDVFRKAKALVLERTELYAGYEARFETTLSVLLFLARKQLALESTSGIENLQRDHLENVARLLQNLQLDKHPLVKAANSNICIPRFDDIDPKFSTNTLRCCLTDRFYSANELWQVSFMDCTSNEDRKTKTPLFANRSEAKNTFEVLQWFFHPQNRILSRIEFDFAVQMSQGKERFDHLLHDRDFMASVVAETEIIHEVVLVDLLPTISDAYAGYKKRKRERKAKTSVNRNKKIKMS